MTKNILFIMCDQLRWDYLSCNGHPWLQTPHIDRLAAEGVNFTRAYCQAPLCGPSRASFYTGRYMSSHGVFANEDPLKPGERTLGDCLRAHGLQTALVGKSDARFDLARLVELVGGGDGKGDGDAHALAMRRAACGGFDPFERLEGLYPDPLLPDNLGYNAFLRANGYTADNPWEEYANSAVDDNGNIVSGWRMRNACYPSRVAAAHSDTAFLTGRAMEFMRAAGDERWCLHLSYLRPHWPYLAPSPYHKLFAREQVVAAVRDEAERRDPHPLYAAFMAQEYSRNFCRDEVRETVIPVYMGLIREVDDNLGRLFDFMRRRGLFDDTLIVFTADHGDYLGDHYLGEKDLFHEMSARIPLLIRDPSAAADSGRGGVNDDLVGAVDLLPTFIEAAGGAPPPAVEGCSLLPALRGESYAPREFIVSEIDFGDRGPRAMLGVHPFDCRAYMARSKQWKYIFHETFRHQLYDLKNDPNEFEDLGDSPAHQNICARMREHLFDWMRGRRTRAEVPLDKLLLRGPARDEEMGIVIGRW